MNVQLEFALKGIGLSFVDNAARMEIAYMVGIIIFNSFLPALDHHQLARRLGATHAHSFHSNRAEGGQAV